ncbi:sigma-70 family RNA polymerase sigma factor [Marinobacter zhejiangensis]|uniref:RNA polymerase sigma-70 factor, ECF subfamily n=1 Tax=Marinobacter zhejiangensis TaxID=488535 RepID=A0A1I4LJY2_9GAMM|nr:sigma-70 family RNA polymerase sigma factor [Marinobacter zhejiangensis]SFL91305.1 RNA polymerase sigma-70 factor, ECF subfamily [Marinobacter zhejiangensis]
MTETSLSAFESHRNYLMALAYRMLGSVSEAEDILQDAWLRWHHSDCAGVRNPRAYLAQVVSRLCLDRWNEASRRRETYVGPWLPEPLAVAAETPSPEDSLDWDVSYALMLALERLSPLERAAFLLHDVFGVGFAEVAETLARSEPACRQLAKRARSHIRRGRPRFEVTSTDNRRIAEAFFTASRQGDESVLRDLLADHAMLHSDGGGVRYAALRVITGADKLTRLFAALSRKTGAPEPLWARFLMINGLPGLLTLEQDGLPQTVAVDIRNGQVRHIYLTRNPAKLLHLSALMPDSPSPLH